MTSYEQEIQQNVAEVEQEQNNKGTGEQQIVLSSGVVLQLGKLSPLLVQALINKFKYPPVPAFWDESREKEIKNPDHPVYKDQCAVVDQNRLTAVMDAILAFGTKVLVIPEGFPAVEDDSWIDMVQVAGIEVQKNSPAARQLAWIRYVAVKDMEDISAIANMYGVSLGVTESGVADSLQSNFPNN